MQQQEGWAGGVWGLRLCQISDFISDEGCARPTLRTERACAQSWACNGALQGQMQPLQCSAGVLGPVLGAAAGLGRWFVGVAILPVCGGFQRRRQNSATTVHRALPVCGWPALGMPWGTAISNAASAVLSMCCEVCTTRGFGRARRVVCGGCILYRCVVVIPRGRRSTRQPQRTESYQCVSVQP